LEGIFFSKENHFFHFQGRREKSWEIWGVNKGGGGEWVMYDISDSSEAGLG